MLSLGGGLAQCLGVVGFVFFCVTYIYTKETYICVCIYVVCVGMCVRRDCLGSCSICRIPLRPIWSLTEPDPSQQGPATIPVFSSYMVLRMHTTLSSLGAGIQTQVLTFAQQVFLPIEPSL